MYLGVIFDDEMYWIMYETADSPIGYTNPYP